MHKICFFILFCSFLTIIFNVVMFLLAHANFITHKVNFLLCKDQNCSIFPGHILTGH